ncbi:MAG: hypothetical protein LBE55_05175 [Clostridiales bacterium]|jgi:hypothetical protein|nr:hypothetical protein [Clostridiales bacterium]
MKERASTFLWLAIAAFVVLLAELLIMQAGLASRGMEAGQVSLVLAHWGFTCALWGLGICLLLRLAKKKGFDIFESRVTAPPKNWIIVLMLLALFIAASYVIMGVFRPLAGFAAMYRLFGDYAAMAFIAQHIYYLFEVALFLAIIAFGQKFGEAAFRKSMIPWGGILCGLTWGLVHIFTQGPAVGAVAAIYGLLYGITYLLLKKNVRYAYPVILLMFVL